MTKTEEEYNAYCGIIFAVIVNISIVLGLLSIVVGLVLAISPLKDKVYMGSVYIYRYYTPLGGRATGLSILGLGVSSLALGLALDKAHVRLAKGFGARR